MLSLPRYNGTLRIDPMRLPNNPEGFCTTPCYLQWALRAQPSAAPPAKGEVSNGNLRHSWELDRAGDRQGEEIPGTDRGRPQGHRGRRRENDRLVSHLRPLRLR